MRYEDHALLILDQRRLPSEEVWLRCETPDQVAEAIRTLAVRGAPAIGLAAAYGIALAADDHRSAAFDLLLATRPTAANLRWALERGRMAADPLAFAIELHAEQEAIDRAISEVGAERLEPGTRALTHCNTGALATGAYGTAAGVLKTAWHAQAARARLGDRDAPAAPGSAADGVGARARWYPLSDRRRLRASAR